MNLAHSHGLNFIHLRALHEVVRGRGFHLHNVRHSQLVVLERLGFIRYEFCQWLPTETGRVVYENALPTQEEWEHERSEWMSRNFQSEVAS